MTRPLPVPCTIDQVFFECPKEETTDTMFDLFISLVLKSTAEKNPLPFV